MDSPLIGGCRASGKMCEPRRGGISYDTDTGWTALFPDGSSPGTLNPALCASVAQTLRIALNWHLATGY